MDREQQAVATEERLESLLSELGKLEQKMGRLAVEAHSLRTDLERMTAPRVTRTLVHG